jgi:uncharacterized protein YcnI
MIRKLATVGAIVTGVVVLFAGPAFAHVEIERDGEVSANGVVAATLHVPNEETAAGTTKIELVFPAAPKLKTAEPEAVNGWTATVQKNAAGEVTAITWTGGPLTGEDEVALPVSIGDVPEGIDAVDFKALQTYDDGTVVRWIEPTPAGGEEPEHPAPVLTVRGEAGGHDDEAADHDDAASSDSHESSDDSTGVTIAIIVGIVVVLAVLGLVLSRTRRDMRSKQD